MKGHEIFVAQTATEMIERGDYLVPYYNGEPRLKKPPLSYWLSIVSHKVFGAQGSTRVTAFEARLPSLTSGILLLVVTFLLGTLAFDDRRVGLVAAAIFATSWSFFLYSRSARPEMLYALFCTAQMLGLVIAVRRASEGRSSTPGAVLAWLAMAGALLAKGPQFPVFLLAGVSLALWIRLPRLSLRRTLHPVLGIALVSLVLPYFVYLTIQTDGAVSLWVEQLVQDNPTPLWLRPLSLYYPQTVLLSLTPWLVPLGLAVVHCWKRRHPNALMLAFGILVSLVFLSFVGKLRQHYVMPFIPLCAVLAAWASVALHDRARQDANAQRLMKWLVISQATLVGCLLLTAGWFSQRENPVSGLPMWHEALPWLLAGGLFMGFAYVFVSRRRTWTFCALVGSLLSAEAAISIAGLDIKRYWATAEEFTAQVAQRVPADKPLVFQGVHSAVLIYYGHRRQLKLRLVDWIAANGSENLPLLVCRRKCRLKGYDLEGRVLLKQRELGQKRYMILFEPSHVRLHSPMPSPDN